MQTHEVRTRRSAEEFPRSEHLAWKIAQVAADPVEVTPEVVRVRKVHLDSNERARERSRSKSRDKAAL